MSMKGVGHTKPLNNQRSEWHRQPAWERDLPTCQGMEMIGAWHRAVNDGHLRAIHTLDNGLHHLSVSFVSWRGAASRYPTWDELAYARYLLMPDDITVVMMLPPPTEYVAVHDTTFHLHELSQETTQ